MWLPLKFICSTKKIRRDGTSLVHIQYCYSSTNRTLLNTEIAIPPSHWNDKKQCIVPDLPSLYREVDHLNKKLKDLFRLAEDLIEYAQQKKIANIGFFVKDTFRPTLDFKSLEQKEEYLLPPAKEVKKDHKLNLYEQIDDYIQSKKRKVASTTLSIYRQMKAQLKAFE